MRTVLAAALLLALGFSQPAAQETARLTAAVGGLPNGLLAAVTVSGPAGYRQTLPRSASLTGLAPGTYSVSAGAVSDGTGTVYLPVIFPDPMVQAGVGQTVSVTIEYETLVSGWEPVGPVAIQWDYAGRPGAGEIRPIVVNPS